jgi:hypothetical protein
MASKIHAADVDFVIDMVYQGGFLSPLLGSLFGILNLVTKGQNPGATSV